jgi:hypothetical protein
MASLYDEKVLGAKERLALARKLQEQGDNVAAGQMVSGWYVPNTGGAITGAIKNIMGGYKEGQAKEELAKAEQERASASVKGLNSLGIEAPPEMALAAGTPAKDPSILSRLGAFVRLEDQPQATPAQPMAQNVAKNVTPEEMDRQSLALSVVNPEVGAMAQTIGNNQANRESRRIAAQESAELKRMLLLLAEQGKNTRQDKNINFQGEQGDLDRRNRIDIRMIPSPNSGGNQSHFVSAGTDPYTGEHIVLNSQTGQQFKAGPNGTLIPIGGASTPPPTGAVPPPTGAPTGAAPPPTGAPPQQPNGAMGGPSAPRLYSPEQNATFSQMYKNQLSGINPRVSTKIQPAYLQWQTDNGIDPSDIVGGTADAKSRVKTALDFTTSGNSGKNIMRIGTAVQHIDVLKDAYKALENGDIPAANSIFNRIAQERGQAPQASFGATAQMVAPEIAAAVLAAGGASALGDRQDYKALLNGNISPAQFKGLVQSFDSLFGGRVKTLATEYKLGTGKEFNYAGHNLSRFAPKEETPQGTSPATTPVISNFTQDDFKAKLAARRAARGGSQ